MRSKTEYYMEYVKAWQVATTREEAHKNYADSCGNPQTPYNLFMEKIRYMKDKKGVELKDLPRDEVNWHEVNKLAKTLNHQSLIHRSTK